MSDRQRAALESGDHDAASAVARELLHPATNWTKNDFRALIATIVDPVGRKSLAAASKLAPDEPSFIDPLEALLRNPGVPEETQAQAIQLLAKSGDLKYTAVLGEVILDQRRSKMLRQWAMSVAPDLKDPALLEVLKTLITRAQEHADIKGYAITAIGRLGVPKGESLLLEVLKGQVDGMTPKLRGHACTSLHLMEAFGAANEILKLLEKETAPDVVGTCITTLGLLRAKGAEGYLTRVVRDTTFGPDLRGAAATALHKIEATSPDALDALKSAVMNDPSTDVRGFAVTSLGLLNVRSALPLLSEVAVNASGVHDVKVRGAAVTALALMRDPSVQSTLTVILKRRATEHPSVIGAAVSAVGVLGTSTGIPLALDVLKDRTMGDDIRGAAATSLGALKATQAAPVMLGLLDDAALGDRARGTIITSLGHLGDPTVVPKLAEIASDPKSPTGYRNAAITSLAVLRATGSGPALVRILQSADDVGVAAAAALALAAIEYRTPEAADAFSGRLDSPVSHASQGWLAMLMAYRMLWPEGAERYCAKVDPSSAPGLFAVCGTDIAQIKQSLKAKVDLDVRDSILGGDQSEEASD